MMAVLLTHNQTFTKIKMQPVLDINGDFSYPDPLLIQQYKAMDPELVFF